MRGSASGQFIVKGQTHLSSKGQNQLSSTQNAAHTLHSNPAAHKVNKMPILSAKIGIFSHNIEYFPLIHLIFMIKITLISADKHLIRSFL